MEAGKSELGKTLILRKMKKLFICVSALTISLLSYCQTSTWELINLSNWGTIRLPPLMEVQSGLYKKIVDEAKKEYMVEGDRIIFQQKGLNSFGNFDTYARVIIKTLTGSPGDFPKKGELSATAEELSELNSSYKQDILKVCKSMNAQLIKWTDLKISTLNGYKCLYFNYSRQISGKPSTYSEFYIFFDYDRQHSLNIEYRIADSSTWQPELEKCKSSFRIK